jgi:2-dehydro-3-deoxygalactonokinase
VSAAYAVAGDWGSTRLRLFRMVEGRVAERVAGPGIGALDGAPADALRAAMAPWRAVHGAPSHVVLCGMAGARGGLAETPYADCPARVAAWGADALRTRLDGVPIAIAPGLACTRADGLPDVMRGEETQLFGAMQLEPRLATGRHRVGLPGTHSKWAVLEDGAVAGFRTFPSGELFALLRDHSSLARVGTDPTDEPEGFEAGLAQARAGGGLLGSLFAARSAQLRAGRTRGWALGYLSGLVIGHEVRELLAEPHDGAAPTLVGDPALAARYARAFATHGVAPILLDGDACALSGLCLFEECIAWT